jgi:hypothetical protein
MVDILEMICKRNIHEIIAFQLILKKIPPAEPKSFFA